MMGGKQVDGNHIWYRYTIEAVGIYLTNQLVSTTLVYRDGIDEYIL